MRRGMKTWSATPARAGLTVVIAWGIWAGGMAGAEDDPVVSLQASVPAKAQEAVKKRITDAENALVEYKDDLAADPDAEGAIREMIRKAREMVAAGDFSGAENELTLSPAAGILQKLTVQFTTSELLAQTERNLNLGAIPWEKARRNLEKVVKAPDAKPSERAVAQYLLALRSRTMLEDLKKMSESRDLPDRYLSEVYRYLITQLCVSGKLEEAEAFLAKYEKAPSTAGLGFALMRVGGLHLQRGNREQARACYEKILVIPNVHPTYAMYAKMGMGEYYLAVGDRAAAQPYFVDVCINHTRHVENWATLKTAFEKIDASIAGQETYDRIVRSLYGSISMNAQTKEFLEKLRGLMKE